MTLCSSSSMVDVTTLGSMQSILPNTNIYINVPENCCWITLIFN
jgi:hypothetical protein